jgi:hypothetical protein
MKMPQKLYDLTFNKRSSLWKNYDDSMERGRELNKLSENLDSSGSADSISSLTADKNNIPDELTQSVRELQSELNNIDNAQKQIKANESKIAYIKETADKITITLIIIGIIAVAILFYVVKNNPSIKTWFEMQGEAPTVESLPDDRSTAQIPHTTETRASEEPTEPPKTEPLIKYTLTVRSNVRNDIVFIDGKNYGSTRVDVELPAGTYTVRVEKTGYSSEEKQIELEKALTLRFDLQRI